MRINTSYELADGRKITKSISVPLEESTRDLKKVIDHLAFIASQRNPRVNIDESIF